MSIMEEGQGYVRVIHEYIWSIKAISLRLLVIIRRTRSESST